MLSAIRPPAESAPACKEAAYSVCEMLVKPGPTLIEQAYDAILAAICDGRLAPGSRGRAQWNGGRTGTVSDAFESRVTEGTRLGVMYGLSTLVISSRSESSEGTCMRLPYVEMSTLASPSGTRGLPESSVEVPRVTSVLWPMGVTS